MASYETPAAAFTPLRRLNHPLNPSDSLEKGIQGSNDGSMDDEYSSCSVTVMQPRGGYVVDVNTFQSHNTPSVGFTYPYTFPLTSTSSPNLSKIPLSSSSVSEHTQATDMLISSNMSMLPPGSHRTPRNMKNDNGSVRNILTGSAHSSLESNSGILHDLENLVLSSPVPPTTFPAPTSFYSSSDDYHNSSQIRSSDSTRSASPETSNYTRIYDVLPLQTGHISHVSSSHSEQNQVTNSWANSSLPSNGGDEEQTKNSHFFTTRAHHHPDDTVLDTFLTSPGDYNTSAGTVISTSHTNGRHTVLENQKLGRSGFRPVITSEATATASLNRRRALPRFSCPVVGCCSTFTRRFNLDGHMDAHANHRPFECDYPGCKKRFVRKHDCRRHRITHNRDKPFVCPGCQRTFPRNDSLKRHLSDSRCQRFQ